MKNSFSPKQFVKPFTLACVSRWQNAQTLRFMMLLLSSLLILSTSFILNGCSGGGGGSSSTVTNNTDDTDTDSYTGSAKVTGTVKLSYLSSSDTSQISSDSGSAKVSFRKTLARKAVDPETEAVKLYVMGDAGELVDTGIDCTLEDVDGDRSYECDGVKDDVNYIVRYVKIATGGKALELKSNAYVPEGAAASETTDVTPQTSVVVEALVNAILTATEDSEIDDETVNTIIESVKTAIVTLVESGAIQIPSMVIEVEEDATLADVVGEDTENEDLDNASGLILNDDTVGDELDYIAANTEAGAFDMSTIDTAEEKAAFIRKVFADLLKDDKGDSEDMPEFFFNFFTYLYVNNETVTAGELLTALIDSLTYSAGAINTDQVSASGCLATFNTFISSMHTLLAKDPATLTAAEKEELADIPGVIRGLFPTSFGTATTSTPLNTPQSIAMVVFFDEVYMPDLVEPDAGSISGTADDSGQISYSDEDYYEWDDEALFMLLGFEAYAAANPELFTGIEIFGLYLHPGSVWIEGTNGEPGEEREALMGGTHLENLAGIIDDTVDENVTDASGATVTLTYPKASGGTGTIALVYLTHNDGGGDGDGYWGIDPWMEAGCDETGCNPINPDRVISDFTSGTYTITVVLGGVTTTKSFEKKVITGMTDKYVKITTPAGMPNWPGATATQAEIDAFNAAWDAFYQNGGRTNFAANVMSDGSAPGVGEEATHAKVTLTWKPPVVTLPEGVKMVYSVDIGQGGCDDTGCYWNPIWNSWENDKRIYTTSFVVPYLFPVQTADDAMNNPYHLNVHVSFVDKETGQQLGSGGNSHTEFTVGEAIVLTNTFKIKGENAITIDDENVTAADLRIAVVKETQDGATFTKTIVGIADIIGETGYLLTFQIGDFLTGASMNSWYNIVLVEDADGTLSAGDNLGLQPTYWPDYSSGGMWFDTWGGVLKIGKDTCSTTGDCVNTQTIITGDEIITGPKFYIGAGNYTPPDPTEIAAVPAEDLAQSFTISGTVDATGVTNPQVVLIKEAYDPATDMHLQFVERIGTIDAGSYSITAQVGDFYDAAGKPTDGWFQVILVDATSQNPDTMGAVVTLEVDKPLGYLPWWSQDWANGGFGFDTWRGGSLYVFTDAYNADTQAWTHTEQAVPGETTTVTGPSLQVMTYGDIVTMPH